MSLKKFDLARNMGLKIEGARKAAPVPGRFGDAAGAVPDRKTQRRLDAAAGLVPFACKLPATLVQQLQARAASHEGGLQALVAELLAAGLAQGEPGKD